MFPFRSRFRMESQASPLPQVASSPRAAGD
jgi:hypothetical protein